MHYRPATPADVPLLAEMNRQLREDEASRYQLTKQQVEQRMTGWIQNEGYTATLFYEDHQPVAYALYKPVEGGIHMRQFFVSRAHRRQGIGQQAIELLLSEVWPPGARITLDVLIHNDRAYQFWKALGFTEYAVTLERFISS